MLIHSKLQSVLCWSVSHLVHLHPTYNYMSSPSSSTRLPLERPSLHLCQPVSSTDDRLMMMPSPFSFCQDRFLVAQSSVFRPGLGLPLDAIVSAVLILDDIVDLLVKLLTGLAGAHDSEGKLEC
mmetsp:Transcript_39030/g.57352  ORF Transcript_39030/g.57352 Transcript_39030/m.57352 type:complete len:124 (-) Transcript_39030:315-686(-)